MEKAVEASLLSWNQRRTGIQMEGVCFPTGPHMGSVSDFAHGDILMKG